MAKGYTSTIQVRCWKEHTCVCCGAVYSYLLSRKVVGRGRTADKAGANAQKLATDTANRETDMQPCPTCGLYQPDMIGQRRAKRRMQILVIALILMAVILIIRAADGLQANMLTWIAGGVCALAALAHLAIDMRNPNSDVTANQNLARQAIDAGQMKLTPGQHNARPDDFARPSRSVFQLTALLLLAAGVVVAIAPELVRSQRKWPLNEACYPPVVGPSDQTRIYMPEQIKSVKSYWRGWPTVTLQDGDETTEIDSSTNQNDWGQTIYAKSEEQSSTSHPWVNIIVPANPALAGRQVKCDIVLALEYPQIANGGSNFNVVKDRMRNTLTVNLAPAGAGTEYNKLWWGATVAGALITGLAGFILYGAARSFQRQARPTRTLAA